MGQGGALVGGAIGGLIGAGVWAAVGYFTGYEVGWIAWGIGFLVGVGAQAGSGGRAGVAGGAIAGALALGAVLAGKYAVVSLTLGAHVDELPVAAIADLVAMEYEDAGQFIEFPPEEEAESWEDLYPADIWAEAEARWAELDDIEQTGIKAALAQEQAEMEAAGLVGALSPFDLLWLVLAVGTAAKIGAASQDEEVHPPVKLLQEPTDSMAVLPPPGTVGPTPPGGGVVLSGDGPPRIRGARTSPGTVRR